MPQRKRIWRVFRQRSARGRVLKRIDAELQRLGVGLKRLEQQKKTQLDLLADSSNKKLFDVRAMLLAKTNSLIGKALVRMASLRNRKKKLRG